MSDDEDPPVYTAVRRPPRKQIEYSESDSDHQPDLGQPIPRPHPRLCVPGSSKWLEKLHGEARLLEHHSFPADVDLDEQIQTYHKINACLTQQMTRLFERKAQAEEARRKKIETAQKNLAEAETKLKERQKRKAEAFAEEKEQEAEVKRRKKAYEMEVRDGQPKVPPVPVSAPAPNASMKR
ncbi:hypothetical protein ONZ45_g12107 [Pleurotus djamor]|nr:hypothetical protein ONZ45_g12107 [Pleurotus djamor]